MKKKISRRTVLAGAAAIVLCLAAGAAAYVAYGIHYPKPEGEYSVGRTKLFFTDESRLETFSEEPDDKRELPVTIYYPAEIREGDQRTTFASKAVGEVLAKNSGFPAFLAGTIKTNSYTDAEPVEGASFPVLLFSGGLYGEAPFYGSLLESIAAEGYIIVSVEHPYSELAVETSDGRLIRYSDAGTAFLDTETDNAKIEANGEALVDIWTADMLYVFDELPELNASHALLAGTMNLAKTGIFGHSFGGAAAIGSLQQRKELTAGINMDGSIYGSQKETPVYQPAAFMNSSEAAVVGAICFREKVVISESSEACYHMILLDSTHASFATDSGIFNDTYPFARSSDDAKIGGREALFTLTAYITAFFDQYLKGEPQEMMEAGYSAEYPQMYCVKY